MSDTPIKKRWYVEYVLLKAIAFLARLVPYRVSLFGAWLLAGMLYAIFRGRVGEAKRRIRLVFGTDIEKRRVDEIAWISFRNTFFSMVEMLRFPITTKAWVQRVFDGEDAIDTLLTHMQTGKGGVIAVPHTGSWELAAVATHLWGVPIFTFSAQQRNPYINEYMNVLRSSPGIEFIQRGKNVYRQAIRMLKAGKFCAILPDVRMREGGVEVDFLGGPANIGTGAAFFARMSDVPVFPCIVTRVGWFKHKMTMHDAVLPDKTLDKAEDLSRITKQLLGIMEETIRKQPEQWFWYNKRWILDPIEK